MLGWEPMTVFICYALETIVTGAFNIPKLISVIYYGKPAEENGTIGSLGLFSVPPFICSYYLLVYFQLAMFFGIIGVFDQWKVGVFGAIRIFMNDTSTFYALGAFFISNVYSFINDFLMPEVYTQRNPNEQFMEPFVRLAVIQLVVFIGSVIYVNTGNTISVLICLTVVKIIAEMILKDHKVTELIAW